MPDSFRDGARRVRAKVYVSSVGQRYQGRGHQVLDDTTNRWRTEGDEVRTAEVVQFNFVSGNDPDGENKKFWDASPEAQPIQMTIANPGAQGIFMPGQEYYIDFVEAIRVPEEG